MIALKVQGLTKTFRTKSGVVSALKNVSFSVEEGEVFAFLGPNGSGKTTTLNVVSGLLAHDAGQVTLLGKKLGEKGYFDKVSFMSGDSDYLWTFDGKQILKFYARLLGVQWKEVEVLIERLNMTNRLERRWETFSNGEKTRIRLIRALMKKPKMLFLDEPTVGLDPDAAQELRTLLRELHKEGMTILLTSHYMKDIEELADRVCFIYKGQTEEPRRLDEFTILEDQVEVEYTSPPSGHSHLGILRGNTLVTSVELLPQALKLGSIIRIQTVHQGLEEYFISLSRAQTTSDEGTIV